MSSNRLFWKDWCRLCARVEKNAQHDFEPLDTSSDLAGLLKRLCGTTVIVGSGYPDKLCPDCAKFAQELSAFADRCQMVNKVYADLILMPRDSDVQSSDELRKQYGLDHWDDGSDCSKLPSIHLKVECASEYPGEFVESQWRKQYELGDAVHKTEKTGSQTSNDEQAAESDPDYVPTGTSIKKEICESSGTDNCVDGKNEFNTQTVTKRKRKKKPNALKCIECGKIFNLVREYKRHMREVHVINVSPINCAKCSERFQTLKQYQKHMSTEHPESKKRRADPEQPDESFICEECGKSCVSKGALKEHKFVHTEVRPFQCALCPKRFKNLPRLKTHEDIHNKTNYVCPYCGIILNTRITLKMHLVVHSDEKRFKCQYCGNEYKRSKALKAHLILHSGLKPYTCPFCDKTFANGSNCRSHKKKAHPVELEALEAAGGDARCTLNIPKLEILKASAVENATSANVG